MTTNQPTPVILDDEALAELERDLSTCDSAVFPITVEMAAALCQTVRALRAELGQRQRTMKFWEDSYLAEHETWGNCQWKAKHTALREQLQAKATLVISETAQENTRLRERLAEVELARNQLSSALSVRDTQLSDLQSRLAQVEKERDDYREQLLRATETKVEI